MNLENNAPDARGPSGAASENGRMVPAGRGPQLTLTQMRARNYWAMLQAVSPADMEAMTRALVAKAMAGHVGAMKLLMQYIGRF